MNRYWIEEQENAFREEEEESVVAAVGVLLGGAVLGRLQRNERHREHRLEASGAGTCASRMQSGSYRVLALLMG